MVDVLQHRTCGTFHRGVCGKPFTNVWSITQKRVRKAKEPFMVLLSTFISKSVVIHIKQGRNFPLLFRRWTLTGDTERRWLEIHRTPYFVSLHLSSPFIPRPSCLILSVDSGRVVMSSNHILQCVKSLHQWVLPVRNVTGSLCNCVPVRVRGVNEVKVCLWWVHPAKRGICTLNLYRFELF